MARYSHLDSLMAEAKNNKQIKRFSKFGDSERKPVSTYLDSNQYDALCARATHAGQSLSEAVRAIVLPVLAKPDVKGSEKS